MHQQDQGQNELTQSNNFRVNSYPQKRWSNYARAKDKQKTFDLYNKKMIALHHQNTGFVNYNMNFQNQTNYENYGNSGGFNSNYLEQQNIYVAPPLEYSHYDYSESQIFHNRLQQPNTENFAYLENQYQFQNGHMIPTTNVPYSDQNHWNNVPASEFYYSKTSNFAEANNINFNGEFLHSNEHQQNHNNQLIYQRAEQEYDCVRNYDSRGFNQYTF